MPQRDTPPIGAPCWIDLSTSDMEKSKAFYGELFGWKAEEAGEDFGGYVNFVKDDVRVAGGMQSDGESSVPDVWSVYLAVDDAQKTTDAAAKHGGPVIVPPMDVGDLGTMAFVTDPGGAAIGLWKPGLHKGFGIYDEPGTPGWFELHTRAYDKAVQFYRDVFAWDAHTASDEPDFRYTTLGEEDTALAGIMDASSMLPEGVPSQWSVYFRVEDTDAALAAISKLGGATMMPAEDSPYGRLAVATDATGTQFKLVS
ncbi:MAG: VOC family protein [Acidimicrobiia bacterium]